MTIEKAFHELVEAEAALLKKQRELKNIEFEYKSDIALLEKYIAQKEAEIKFLMGDVEYHVVEGDKMNFKISYTNPKGRVKVTDLDAIPEGMYKTEKKPEAEKIRKYLDEHGLSNWAEIETSEPKIQIRSIKK